MNLSDCILKYSDDIPAPLLAEIRSLNGKFNDKELINVIHQRARKRFLDFVATLKEKGIPVKENTEIESIGENTKPSGSAVRGYYSPENTLIRLTNAANLSTWFHEFAHFMFDMEVKADTEYSKKIKEFLKKYVSEELAAETGHTIEDIHKFIDNYKEASVNPSDIEKGIHEYFARSFEKYLMQDKTVPGSRGIFRYISEWFKEVYNRVELGSSEIPESMREVFDALTMTDEMIYQQEVAMKYDYLVTHLERIIEARNKDVNPSDQEVINEAELEKLKTKLDDATNDAKEKIRRKLFEEVYRRERKAYQQELEKIANDELKVILETKEYVAQRRLRSDLKLSRDVLKSYLESRNPPIKKIPYALRGMSVTGKNGIADLGLVSSTLGFNSVDEMIDTMLSLKKPEEVATENARQKMIERHGSLKDKVSELVDEAMVSEKRAAALLAELKLLKKGQENISPVAIREVAAKAVSRLTPRELNIRSYRLKEIAAARKGAIALYKGDLEEAAHYKEVELANHYLQLEAKKYLDIHEKLKKRSKQLKNNSSTLRKTLAYNTQAKYYEHYNNLLSQVGLTTAIPDTQPLSEWYAEQRGMYRGLVINDYILKYGNEDIKDVPFNIQQGVLDAADSIYAIAKSDKMLSESEEAIKLNAAIEDAIRVIDKSKTIQEPGNVSEQVTKKSFVKSFREGFRTISATLTKVAWMMVFLDRGEKLGANYNLVFKPIYDGYNEKLIMQDRFKKPIADAVSNFSKETIDNHNKLFVIPEAYSTDPVDGSVINDGRMLGSQLVMIVLNAGNKSNREKMIKGEGWGSDLSINNPVIQFALNHITEEDYHFIQLVWDKMDEMQKPLFDVHRKVTGKVLKRIEGEKFNTPFGELRGGYFPVVYDTTTRRGGKSLEAFRNKLREIEELQFSGMDDMLSPTPSATKDRTDFNAPLQLTMDVIDNHFTKNIHYIALREKVKQVNDVVNDTRYKRAVIRALGEEHHKAIVDWLQDISKEGQYIDSSPIDKLAKRLNGSLTIAYMGYSLSTFLLQVLGLSVSASELGSKRVVSSLMELMRSKDDAVRTWDWVKKVSPIMANRIHTMDRELQNAIKLYANGESVLDKVRRNSMTHIAYMQTFVVDFPTWLAAYKKGLNDFEGQESKAIEYADFVVEQMQGSGSIHNMASLFRNKKATHQMYTMFMTFFSAQLMLQRNAVRGVREGYHSPIEAVRQMMWVLAVPAAIEMLMRGEVDDDDDPYDIASTYIANLGALTTAGVPVLRDIYNWAIYDYNRGAMSITPLMGEFTTKVPQARTAITKLINGDDPTDAQWRALFRETGILLNIPGVSQAEKIAKMKERYEINPYYAAFPSHN